MANIAQKYRVAKDRTRYEIERAKAQYEKLKHDLSQPVSRPSASSSRAYGPAPKPKPIPKAPKSTKSKARKKKSGDWLDDLF